MMRWVSAPGTRIRRCLFLDRDGVINELLPNDYVREWETFRWRNGVIAALSRVTAAGIPLVVVTNQSCVGRALVGAAQIESIMTTMRETLADAGVPLAAWYCCPHAPSEECFCRKPLPGMLLEAARDVGIDLRASFLIGDSETDIAAADAVGCTSYRIDDSASFDRAIDAVVALWSLERSQ